MASRPLRLVARARKPWESPAASRPLPGPRPWVGSLAFSQNAIVARVCLFLRTWIDHDSGCRPVGDSAGNAVRAGETVGKGADRGVIDSPLNHVGRPVMWLFDTHAVLRMALSLC